MLTLFITCSSSSINSERRIDPNTTIAKLKICRLDGDDKRLCDFPVESNMRIHAVDTNPHASAGEFEDVSKVEKFELTAEEYSKRSDTVRAFKERNKIGRFNPEIQAKMEEQAALKEVEGQEQAAAMKVGQRCQVSVTGGGGPRRGTIKFVGKTQFQQGYWVGVQYDEPVGKHDGSVEGVRYFTCLPKYGAMVRPAAVEVGDFPEEDLFGDEM